MPSTRRLLCDNYFIWFMFVRTNQPSYCWWLWKQWLVTGPFSLIVIITSGGFHYHNWTRIQKERFLKCDGLSRSRRRRCPCISYLLVFGTLENSKIQRKICCSIIGWHWRFLSQNRIDHLQEKLHSHQNFTNQKEIYKSNLLSEMFRFEIVR